MGSRRRSLLGRALCLTAVYFIVGAAITIGVAWGLAAFLPQEAWSALGRTGPWTWAGDSEGSDYRWECNHLEFSEYCAFGSTRRSWDIPTGHSPWLFYHWSDAIKNSAVDWSRITFFDPSTSLSWPGWGVAEQLRSAIYIEADDTALRRLLDLERRWEGCEHATGWPFRALWYGFAHDDMFKLSAVGGISLSAPIPGTTGVSLGGPPVLVKPYAFRALPTNPIWTGIFADAAVWGAMCALLVHGRVAARRWLRSRRGCCPECAYDLRHELNAGCSECGWNRRPKPTTSA